MSIKNLEYECTKKCKSALHGQKITSALTKRSIDDNLLAAYIAKTCQNFVDIHDYLGRTALHIAASVDKYPICEWLLNNGALINTKENESGSSPLHRALFYGCIDCAVLLIKTGASLEILDNDTCRPFQNICKMKDIASNKPNFNDLLVWGSNKNYNLGIGNNDFAKIPQFIDLFRMNNISISHVGLSAFHSIVVDTKGNLYAVGSGAKGRLGINSESNLPVPKRINKLNIKNSGKIIDISVSRNHSMILTSTELVYVCGSNEFKQLGFKPPPEMLLTFREIPSFQHISGVIGIVAKDFYSIAYTNKDVYVWGKNLGQYGGIDANDDILLPKQIQIPDCKNIEYVEASNFAIVIATTAKHIFLYYNYKVKVIKPPVLEAVKSLSLFAPDPKKGNDKSKDKTVQYLKLLLLSDTNVLYIWSEDIQQFYRCSFAHQRLPVIDKIFLNHNKVFLMSQGDVYFGKCNKIPISSVIKESESAWLSSIQSKKEVNNEYKIRIELNYIDGIDRAVNIFCDEDLESFAVLQEHSRSYYVVSQLYPGAYNFKKLLNDVNEFDSIHDLIFHVDEETFFAHKFIIYSRSKGLRTIIENFNDKDIYLNYKNFTGKMFELMLKYMYCNYFMTLDDMDDINHSLGPKINEKDVNAIEIFLEVLEKFTLVDLISHIKSQFQKSNLKVNDKKFNKTKANFMPLKRSNFPQLYDVKIKCANNLDLKAHKCVLVTRLEYFNLMFVHNWSETTSINLSSIPIEYMEPMIDFLYSEDMEHFKKQNYNENFLYNMIVICDQFFIKVLQELCENLILKRITIRKCGEMLEFAESYNCEVLRHGCMDFICQNLSRVLYQKSLEVCEPETLKNLNIHYRKIFQDIFDYRHITPDTETVSDEELLRIVGDFKIDLDYRIEENATSSKNTKRNKIKEEKFKIDRRNYEKDAISSKLKEMKEENLNNILHKQADLSNKKADNLLKEVNEINKNLVQNSSSWTKVDAKKEPKKKSFNGNAKINCTLMQEQKPKENFINLNKIVKPLSSKKELENFNDDYQELVKSENRHSINFGDFALSKSGKMSQKQRKRLSSELSTDGFDSSFKQIESPTKPISIPTTTQNAWGVISTPPSYTKLDLSSSFSNTIKSTPNKTKNISIRESPNNNSTDFENSIAINNNRSSYGSSSSKSLSGTISKQNSSYNNNSQINQIFEDEKRQKDYFEKMRNKSLILTQIEETAISELREFYNADNCEDEIITISRRPMHINYDLPVWQKS